MNKSKNAHVKYGLHNNEYKAKEIWDKENRRNIKLLKFSICLGIIMSLLFSAFMFGGYANALDNSKLIQNQETFSFSPNDNLFTSADGYIKNYSQQLGGAMSSVVSMSVSPLTSLTILSGIGTVQGADTKLYPYLQPLKKIIENLPIDLSGLPFANSEAFLALFVIFALCFILRALHYTKIFTFATINKLENLFGQIIAVLLVLLTTSTTQVYAAAITSQPHDVSLGMYIATTSLSIIASAASGIIYYFIKTVCLCLEVLTFISSTFLPPVIAVPISTGFETIRTLASVGLTMLAFIHPAASIIVSIIISAICAYFFKKSYNVITYFKFIYVKPFWNAIFHRNKLFPMVWSSVPKKLTALFDTIEISIPVFPMKRIQKIGKKEKCWLIFDGEKIFLCKNRIFRKPFCMSLNELVEENNTIFMQKTSRFLRIFSDEQLKDSYKRLLIVVSREYNNQFEDIIEILGLINYNELEEVRKEEQRIRKEENKMAKLQAKQANKEEMLKKKQELILQSVVNKQQQKMKQKEFKENLKKIKSQGKKPDLLTKLNVSKNPLPENVEPMAPKEGIGTNSDPQIDNVMEEVATTMEKTYLQ